MKVELRDVDDNVVEEKEIHIGKGDKLVFQFTNGRTFREAAKAGYFEKVAQSFKTANLIFLIPDIDLKVLKIEDGDNSDDG